MGFISPHPTWNWLPSQMAGWAFVWESGVGPKCWCAGMAVIQQAALVSELVLRGAKGLGHGGP